MKKNKKGSSDINFLQLFKQSLAVSFTFFLFGNQQSYSTTITGDSNFNTVISKDYDGNYNIVGGIINNSSGTGFHHFTQFELSQGDVANMIFNTLANKYVNLVDGQIRIDGIFNALKNGAPGNVVFVSPNGMIVGASGIMNVGSLQTITPNATSFNNVVKMGRGINDAAINGLRSDSTTSNTEIHGKIFAQNAINIGEANQITIGQKADIVSGFNTNGFSKTGFGKNSTVDLSGIVNSNGIVDSAYLTGSSGNIRLTANNISSENMIMKGGLIQSTGDVTIDTSSTNNSQIRLSSKIHAGNNATIGHINSSQSTDLTGTIVLGNTVNAKNISINGDIATINKGADLTATQTGGTVSTNTFRQLNLNSNITADGNINIKSTATFEQGKDSTIKSTNKGNITVNTVTLSQNTGASIINEGTGNITLNAPGNVSLQKVTANNGSIEMSTGSLSLNDKISSSNDINIRANKISQAAGSFTALESGNNINLNTIAGDIGNESQSLNLSAQGKVSLDTTATGGANVKGTGDNDLNISKGNDLLYLNASSENGIKISGNIISGGDVNLDAATGITQNADTMIYSNAGDVNLSNTTSGDITTGTINTDGGSITVGNTGVNGAVNINKDLVSKDSLIISSQGGVNQADGANLVHNGNGEFSITNSVAGDLNLKNITNNTGNIILKNDAQNGNVSFNNLTGNNGFVDISSKGDVTQNGTITAGKENPLNNSSVNIKADGQASLNKIDGPNDITVNADNVVLNNLITAESGEINITANNNISQSTIEQTLSAKGDIQLQSNSGNVGAIDQRIIGTTEGNIYANAAGSANIEGKNTNIVLANIQAGTDYNLGTTGTGDILLGGAFHNANGGIKLDTDKALNITDDITAAGDISLISKDGIHQTDGTNIESGLGTAASGNIEIVNFGGDGITLTKVTAHKGGIRVENVETANGNIELGTLNATGGEIYASNNALNGDIKLNSKLTTDSNIELRTKRNIIQDELNNDIALNAGNNIDLSAAEGFVGQNSKSIQLNAGNIVNASSATNVYLESPGNDLKIGTINSNGIVDLKTTNNASGTNNDIILTNIINGKDINVDAQGSILQDTPLVGDKTINVTGDITLTAHTGDIGSVENDAVKSIGFSNSGSLSANAVNGSVALNGINTDIDTTNVNAGKNIDLSTSGTGNIIVSNEQNVNGYISLNSANDILLNKKVQATQDITLNAKENITQDEGLTGTALKSDRNINITAKNAGTEAKHIVVDAQEVNVGTEGVHAGSVYLEDNTGDFTVGQMFADDNLSLKAYGNILQSNNSNTAITSSGKVTLSSETGSIGDLGSNVPLNVNISGDEASLNVTKSTNVNVASKGNDLNAGNIDASGTVSLSTIDSGNIGLKGLISGKDILINAVNDIIQDKNVDTKTLNATDSLSLTSINGNIGATGDVGSALKFSSNSLSASAEQGSVYLNGIETTINTSDIKALNDIDLTTTGSGNINVNDSITAKGHIKLNSADELNLNGNLTADDYIDVAANGGDILLNSILTAQTDINVTASGSIKQDASNNSIVLNAGKDINLKASSDIGAIDKSILLNADGVVNAKAGETTVPVPGSVYLSSVNKTIKTGKVSATNDVKISATGTGSDVTLTDKITGKNVDIHAAGSIVQDVKSAEIDRSIEAQQDLTLTADTGNIGTSGNSVDFSAGGNLSASAQNGSVYLNGIDTNINTSSIKAKNDIDLSTQNSGKITVSENITTNDGYIRLSSAESLELNKNLSAGKHITLDANGGILQSAGNSITSGTNASTGAGQGNINITNKNGGNVDLKNVTANKGSVNIKNNALPTGSTATAGNVTLGNITANGGTLDVLNAAQNGNILLDGLLSADKDISMVTSGDISQNTANTGLAINTGGNLILNAGGDLGADLNNLKLNATGTVKADGNNVYLESLNKDLNIAGVNSHKEVSNGTVDLKTTGAGNTNIKGLVKGGKVSVDSAQGIYQDSSVVRAIDASSDLSLTANNGSIGSKDAAKGGALIFSSGGNLSASASEAVVLHGVDTDIITSSINAGTDIDLKTTIDKDATKGSIIVNNALNATNGYISLDSAKGLNVNQNITASDHILLAAKDGNISLNSAILSDSYIDVDANGNIVQSGGSLTAKGQNADGNGININTDNGSVTITNASSQNGGIQITANESPNAGKTLGDITAGGLNANGGKITIKNFADAKDIILSDIINANTSNIEITSQGKISQNTANTTLTTNADVVLNAKDNVGSASNSVLINADGTVEANGKDIYLGSKDQNLNITGINSSKTDNTGIVNLKTDTGNIHLAGLVKGGNVKLDSAQGISQEAGLTKSIDANNITLNANGGSVGSNGNAIDISVKNGGKVDGSAQGDIYLNSPEGDLTTGTLTANNTVDINSSAGIKLDGLITAKDAILTAVNDIVQGNVEKSIHAVNVNLTSTTGNIGEAAVGETPANAIDFSATGSLRADAQNGSLVLNGVNTSINTDSVSAGKNIDLSTTGAGSNITVSNNLNAGGYIRLNSAEGLILDKNLNATDYVSLAAQKDILLNSLITAGTDIDINAAGQITQQDSNNNTVLNAGNDITLTAGTNIGTSTKSIMMNANGTVTAGGQNIYLTSPDKQLNIAGVTSTNGGTIKLSTTGSGNVHLQGLVKGGNVNIDSAKSITQDSSLNKSIQAGNSLVLNAQDGDVGEAAQNGNPANAIDFSAGSVEAHAAGGSVVLNGVESNINTSSITADKNIDLTTTTSGTITVSSQLNTNSGYINLNSAETLTLNENVTAGDYVSLGAKGDILLNSIVTAGTDINIDTNGNLVQQINDIALNAGNDINIKKANNVGSVGKAILLNAQNAVNVDSAKNVYLEDTTGDFTIGVINAENDVKLTADGNLLQADYTKDGVVAGGNVDLTSKNANIGSTAADSIKLNVNGLVNATAQNGSAYLGGTHDINVGNITAKNTANIDTDAGISLNGLIKANEANLTAKNNITQVNDGKTIEAAGGNINLTSKTGNIGTPNGNAIGFSLQGSGVVNADASANGSVVLKGIDSNINTSTIKAKNDIDLTTTGSGNITVSNDLNAGGYISLDSANELLLNNNLTADKNIELIARNGDILLNAIMNAGEDIALDASGSVIQQNTNTSLIAGSDISIKAGQNIGSDIQSILLNSGGNVTAQGADIYLTSNGANLTTGAVKASGIAKINTTGSGSITVNDLITGNKVDLNSAENVNINKNITAQNGVTVDAQKGISQAADSTVSTANSNLSMTAHNGNLDLQGTVSAQKGDVSIVNESTGNAILNVNKLTAGNKFNIRHEGNGLLTFNGAVNNNGNSNITANNTGSEAGVVLNGTINNNKGTLNIESNGQKGTTIKGNINNDLLNDSTGAHSDIIVRNNNGALNVTSSVIDNGQTKGSQNNITFVNNGNGGLNINSNITNLGKLTLENNAGAMNLSGALKAELGSENSFINGGNNDFTINSQIENKGNTLTFLNKGAGSLVLGENAFITVYSVLDGTNIYTGTLNLQNTGTSGNIQIDGKISGLNVAGTPQGNINIENSATGADSGIIFGSTASVDAKNNNLTISNGAVGTIDIAQGVNIKSDADVLISNAGNGGISYGGNGTISGDNLTIIDGGSGNITFGNDTTINAKSDLEITKDSAGSIGFGDNAHLTSGKDLSLKVQGGNSGLSFGNGAILDALCNLMIQNSGLNGVAYGNNAVLNAGEKLTINNMSDGGITFGDDTALTSGLELNLSDSGTGAISFGDNSALTSGSGIEVTDFNGGGISFGNNAKLNSQLSTALQNDSTDGGIIFGDGANITAKKGFTAINEGSEGINLGKNSTVSSDTVIGLLNKGEKGINIGQGTNLNAKGALNLTNTGTDGITINGSAKGDTVDIDNENSNVYIAHDKAEGTISADKNVRINITNGSLLNSTTGTGNNTGIKAGNNLVLNVTGGSIGILDSTLNNIIQNGFVLNPNNAINVSVGGKITAHADNDLNLKSVNSNMNFDSLSAKNALLSTLNGSINTASAATDNLYLYAKGTNSNINIQNLTNTGKLTSESDLNTTIQSNGALNADSMLSKNGSININSEGNTYINEIAAAEDITINVEDEKLTINDLGRVERDKTVIPKTVNLTVKDAKRPQNGTEYQPGTSYDEIKNVGPNSKLDIYNAYVRDKVTMKADTITAQVYDISDGAVAGQKRVDANGKEATGFHNANTNGKLLEFDIQGANYAQEDVGSNPNNPYYNPDADDKHALNVHLTIGDSVNGAQFGADFKKLYSDYAFIDTVGSDANAFSTLVIESAIIGEKAIFRNNKFRVDIDNASSGQEYPINKHYNDTPDLAVNNDTSFNLKMSDKIEMDLRPEPPVDPSNTKNDPNKIVRIPTMDSLTKDPSASDADNSAVDSSKSTGFHNIGWVVRNTDNQIIGSSEEADKEDIKDPVVKSLVGISQNGILVCADTSKDSIQKGQTVRVEMKLKEVSFNIDGKINSINGNIAEIGFINIDKLTSNVMLFLSMYNENL